MPEISVDAIKNSYQIFPALINERKHLQNLIAHFQSSLINFEKLKSETPIQIVVVPGNENVKMIAQKLQDNNLDVRAILYPTVPKNSERLRIVLHAFNTIDEINLLINALN